jgi:hypothetical protein
MTTSQPIPLQPWEVNTWKDIVHIPANTTARVIMDFEGYAGRFPNHCHLLDHEDHEMMRQFQATYDPANCNNNGSCEFGEDCQSCPNDCAVPDGVSGAPGGTGNIGCGVDVDDNRCIDSSANLYCRLTERVPACCGDAMCEGEETIGSCAVDCDPNAVCQPAEPTEVSCFNGQDDDCDLDVDCSDTDCNGATGAPTNCGVGVCSNTGNLTCSGGNEVDNCSPLPADEPGGEVTCDNGLDDDCDGLTDLNDPDCNVCVPDEDPEATLCFDGNDNDCDGQTDCSDTSCDGALGAATTCGVGACQANGNLTCSGGTEVDSCTPGTPGVEGPFGDASCNDGQDNDCDGLTDVNDPDCEDTGGVVCEDITTRNACRGEPTCQWKKNACITR